MEVGATKWKCMVVHGCRPMSNVQPELAHQFLQNRPDVKGPSNMPNGSVCVRTKCPRQATRQQIMYVIGGHRAANQMRELVGTIIRRRTHSKWGTLKRMALMVVR